MFRSQDIKFFLVCMNYADLKICDVIKSIVGQWKLHFSLFLLNPEHYQNEIWSNANVLYDKHF